MGNFARDAGKERDGLEGGAVYRKDGVERGGAEAVGRGNERDARGGGLACISVLRAFPARPLVSAEGCGWV